MTEIIRQDRSFRACVRALSWLSNLAAVIALLWIYVHGRQSGLAQWFGPDVARRAMPAFIASVFGITVLGMITIAFVQLLGWRRGWQSYDTNVALTEALTGRERWRQAIWSVVAGVALMIIAEVALFIST